MAPIDGDNYAAANNGAIIFLNREKNYNKLFYAYNNISDFGKLLNNLPDEEIYLEIITKKTLDSDLQEILKYYFEFKTIYQKLYKKFTVNNEKILPKCKIDTNLIYEKIYSTFDIYFEHLMEEEELQELVNNNKVLTVYENEELKSFLIYKTQGTKAYLNHIANYGSKENLINLWKIFYQALNFDNIKYLDLWYNKQNKKAENMYRIEQFLPLNMYNYTYKKLSRNVNSSAAVNDQLLTCNPA